MALQEFIPTPKFEEYKEVFKDFFNLERRDDGVLLAQAHTLNGHQVFDANRDAVQRAAK